MSITFKFKSVKEFETLDIERKPCISIGEARSRIMNVKKLDKVFRKDFDLLLYDAVTGQEYGDDMFEIRSGSSLIVKRVPTEVASSAMLGYQRPKASHPRDDNLKGLDQKKSQKTVRHENQKPDSHKQINLKSYEDPLTACLPSLKCPVCYKYFKEAVVMQCCSHSFCEECIRLVLLIKGECPMCHSTEYGLKDLIPNVSLNQMVKRIEPQHVVDARENVLQKYASDEGSGIQGNNISYDAPITKRNKGLFNYTSAKGQGSNLDKVEYAYTLQNEKVPITTAAESRYINQPLIMPQNYMPLQGGHGPFTVGSTSKKVDFTCYACGSPDHLIRDCPIAHAEWVSGDPMFPGVPCFATPFWVGAPAPQVNFHMNMCGSLGVVPFGGSMIPAAPYGVPNYLPSLFNTLPIPRQPFFEYEYNVPNNPYADPANRERQPGSSSRRIHHDAEKELGGIRKIG